MLAAVSVFGGFIAFAFPRRTGAALERIAGLIEITPGRRQPTDKRASDSAQQAVK